MYRLRFPFQIARPLFTNPSLRLLPDFRGFKRQMVRIEPGPGTSLEQLLKVRLVLLF